MGEGVNCIHHVVWCIKPESMAGVRALWEEALGLEMQDIDLPELGVHVMIAWEAGIEIMSPTYEDGALAQSARDFLEQKGEGVYSVVYNVENLESAVAKYAAHGAKLVFQEDIPADEVEDRNLSDDASGGFAVKQALFDEIFGIRICLQQMSSE